MIPRPYLRGSPLELNKRETFAHKGRLERDALGRLAHALFIFNFTSASRLRSFGANGRQAPAAASVYYKSARRINPLDRLARAPRLWASHAATTACARRTTRGH